jgi:hypothetical protein
VNRYAAIALQAVGRAVFGGFSVSPTDVGKVAEYIAQQETHHRAMIFQEEHRRLLESHGIAFDERYVWD